MERLDWAIEISKLEGKLAKTAAASARIEIFRDQISSINFPDNLPNDFPNGLDVRPVVEDQPEFSRRIDRLDLIASISAPRSAALLRTREVGLTEAINYAKSISQIAIRHRAGKVSDEELAKAQQAFEVIRRATTDPRLQKREQRPAVTDAESKASTIQDNEKPAYQIQKDQVILRNGRILIGYLARTFICLVDTNAEMAISRDDLHRQVFGESEPIIPMRLQTLISRLRRSIFPSGLEIPLWAARGPVSKGQSAKYYLQEVATGKSRSESATPAADDKSQLSTPNKKRPEIHVDSRRLGMITYLLEHPFATPAEIIAQYGLTKRDRPYTIPQAMWAVKGVIGLLFNNQTHNCLSAEEQLVIDHIKQYATANKLGGRREIQVMLARRLKP